MDRSQLDNTELYARSGGVSSVVQDLLDILNDMTRDWETDVGAAISPDTWLVQELDFASIDMVALIVKIEEKYRRRDWPFESLLMVDGRYVDDLRVADIAAFLYAQGAGSESVLPGAGSI
jgi:acyl carrier protein